MANNTPDEEIIEKRPSNPVATACLVVAGLATLGAIVFQIAEVRDVRAGMTQASERDADKPYVKLYEKNLKEFRDATKKVIDENSHPELTVDVQPAPADQKAGKGVAPAATPTAETPPEAPAAKEEPAPASEEKAADAPAPADAEDTGKDAPKEADKPTEGAAEPPAADSSEKAAGEPASKAVPSPEVPSPEVPAPAEPAPADEQK